MSAEWNFRFRIRALQPGDDDAALGVRNRDPSEKRARVTPFEWTPVSYRRTRCWRREKFGRRVYYFKADLRAATSV